MFNEEELALRETVFLNTDREMPLLGLGVYKQQITKQRQPLQPQWTQVIVLSTLLPHTKMKKA